MLNIIRTAIVAAMFAATALHAQTLPDLLNNLRGIASNPDASDQDLMIALGIMDTIVQNHPESPAANSILLLQPFEGINFADFRRRLTELQAGKPAETATDTAGVPTHLSCLRDALSGKTNGSLIINVTLAEDGAISGLPVLSMPPTPNETGRRDYVKALQALEDCAPFTGISVAGEYILAAYSDGQVSLVAAGPAIVSALPTANAAPSAVIAPVAPTLPPAGVAPLPVPLPTPLPVPAPDATASSNLPTFFASSLTLATEQTEQSLGLDRQAIRDIQARLQVLGFDPNGIDGVAGQGTRIGLRQWQASIGAPVSGYLDAQQLAQLKLQSQPQLDAWLQSPENAQIYTPPQRTKSQRSTKRRTTRRRATGWYRVSDGRYCRRLGNGQTQCRHTTPDDLRR